MPECSRGQTPRDPAAIVVVGGGVGGSGGGDPAPGARPPGHRASNAATSSAASSPRTNATATPSTSARRSSRCPTCSTRCSAPRAPRSTSRSTWSASTRSSRYHWPDGSSLIVPDGDDETARAPSTSSAPGAGGQWRAFDARGRRIWDVADRTFFAGPMSNPWSLAKRMRSPFDLTAIDPHAHAAPLGRVVLRRPPPRPVGRPLRHVLRVRRRTRRRPRSPASRTSRPASGAGIRWAASTRSRAAFERVARETGVEIHTGARRSPDRRCRRRRRLRRRAGRRVAANPPTSSSPTPTPSTCTPTCCPTPPR